MSTERNTYSTRKAVTIGDDPYGTSDEHQFKPEVPSLKGNFQSSTRIEYFGDSASNNNNKDNQIESQYSSLQPTVMQYTATEVNSFVSTNS